MKKLSQPGFLVRIGVVLVSSICALAQTSVNQQNDVPPEWQIRGSVRGESGFLRGMYVIASGPHMVRPVQTDGSGQYLLRGTEPGTYSIRIQQKDDTSEPSPRTVTISKGQTLDDVNFKIAKGGVITGRVLNRLKQPQVGLTLIAYRKSFQDSRLRLDLKGGAHSNDLGEYRIANLPPGTYVVAAETVLPKTLPISKVKDESQSKLLPSYPPMTFSPSGRDLSSAYEVEIKIGEVRSGIDIVMDKVAVQCISFSANAVFPDGREGAHLGLTVKEWLGAEGATIGSSAIEPGERYQICGVPAGEYRLHPFSLYRRPKMRGTGYLKVKVVVDKQDVKLAQWELPEPQDLMGKIVLRGGKTGESFPKGIQIRLERRDRSIIPNDTLMGVAEENGSFVLPKVFVDDYGLEIANLPAGYFVASANQNGRDVRKGVVTPGAGELLVEIESSGASVSGRVLTHDGKPVPEATVFLAPRSMDDITYVQTDQFGAYQVATGLPEGEYKVVAIEGLVATQWKDKTVAQRMLSEGSDLRLGSNERKVLDLKVLPTK